MHYHLRNTGISRSSKTYGTHVSALFVLFDRININRAVLFVIKCPDIIHTGKCGPYAVARIRMASRCFTPAATFFWYLKSGPESTTIVLSQFSIKMEVRRCHVIAASVDLHTSQPHRR